LINAVIEIIPGLKITESGIDFFNRDGDFPKGKGVGIDVLELVRCLLFDGLLQDTDILSMQYFNWKATLGLIAHDPTVES
jgi:hypothetical protein